MEKTQIAIVELRLDGYERAVERSAFLRTIKSGLVTLYFLAVAAVAVTFASYHTRDMSDPWPALLAIALAIVVMGLGLAFAFHFIGRLFRVRGLVGIVLLPAIFGIAIVAVGLQLIWVYNQRPAWVTFQASERLFDWYWTTALGRIVLGYWPYIVVVLLLVPISLGLQVVWDALRLCRTPKELRAIALPAGEGVAQAIGAHPVCRFLPGRVRRLATSALFILASALMICALTVLLFVLGTGPLTMLQRAQDCLRTGRYEQWGHCMTDGMLGWITPLTVALVLFGALAVAARIVARRLTRVSLEQLSETDRRPPVLFLRSFLDDQVRLRRPRRSFWHWLVALGEPKPNLDRLLLEEATPHGPVVAIGVPGSPPPFGAARIFLEGDAWQGEVAKLSAAARAIVVVLDDTDGVLWELAHIRQSGHDEKSVFLLPRRLTEPAETIRIVQRDLDESGEAPAALAAAASILRQEDRRCIGWYRDGKLLLLLTARRPSSRSYVCALRLALMRGERSGAQAGG